MGIIIELILQFIFEVTLQVVGQILVEFGFGWLVDWLKRTIEGNPIFIGLTYFLLGLILGSLSLLFFPDPIIKNYALKVFFFVVSPILIGLSLCFFSWAFAKKNVSSRFFRIEKFVFGVIFALAYSLTRFYFNL